MIVINLFIKAYVSPYISNNEKLCFFLTEIADPGGIDPDLTLKKKPVPKTGITPYFLYTPLYLLTS